jgi:poly(3-hydroxybutyrate) depolymerase
MRRMPFFASFVPLAACSPEPRPDYSQPVSAAAEGEGIGTAGDHATRLSAGCGRAASPVGAVVERVTKAGGKPRQYYVSVPPAYDAAAGHALLIVMHSAGETAPEKLRESFPVEKGMPSAISAYPQALPRKRTDGTSGEIPRWDITGNDDTALFDQVLAEIGSAYCLDLGRVFITGFSSGGNISQHLACMRRDAVRAFGAVSGPGPFSADCGGPVAAWMTHDANDTVLPIDGAQGSRDFWATTNGCGAVWGAGARPECKRNTACSSHQPVVFCETKGIGHAVPDFAPGAIAAFFESIK